MDISKDHAVQFNGISPDNRPSNLLRLAVLFGTNVDKVESLASQAPFIIKRGLSAQDADSYVSRIRSAGGLCESVSEHQPLHIDFPTVTKSRAPAREYDQRSTGPTAPTNSISVQGNPSAYPRAPTKPVPRAQLVTLGVIFIAAIIALIEMGFNYFAGGPSSSNGRAPATTANSADSPAGESLNALEASRQTILLYAPGQSQPSQAINFSNGYLEFSSPDRSGLIKSGKSESFSSPDANCIGFEERDKLDEITRPDGRSGQLNTRYLVCEAVRPLKENASSRLPGNGGKLTDLHEIPIATGQRFALVEHDLSYRTELYFLAASRPTTSVAPSAAVHANSPSSLPANCARDNSPIKLQGMASRVPLELADGRKIWVDMLSLARPLCIVDSLTNDSDNVTKVQINGANPPTGVELEVTGTLTTGNVTQYYAVPTAIEVKSQAGFTRLGTTPQSEQTDEEIQKSADAKGQGKQTAAILFLKFYYVNGTALTAFCGRNGAPIPAFSAQFSRKWDNEWRIATRIMNDAHSSDEEVYKAVRPKAEQAVANDMEAVKTKTGSPSLAAACGVLDADAQQVVGKIQFSPLSEQALLTAYRR